MVAEPGEGFEERCSAFFACQHGQEKAGAQGEFAVGDGDALDPVESLPEFVAQAGLSERLPRGQVLEDEFYGSAAPGAGEDRKRLDGGLGARLIEVEEGTGVGVSGTEADPAADSLPEVQKFTDDGNVCFWVVGCQLVLEAFQALLPGGPGGG